MNRATEADQFWPRIIADDQFSESIAKLEPYGRDAAFFRRLTDDPAFRAETSIDVQRFISNKEDLMALVEMVEVREALGRRRRPVH